MAAAIVLGFFLTVAAVGAVKVAHNTTTTLTCRGRMSFPAWYLNGSVVPLGPLYRFEHDPITGDLMSILVIDGNNTCGTLDLKCSVETSTTFTIRLTVQGPLPSPENMTISSQNFATQLQWKHPYYMTNQYSDVIHVDPHITHYTVYTTDAYTRRIVESVNTTKTTFTPRHTVPLCPMYRVSAWNPGGEGELSDPVQESTPQAPHKLTADAITAAVIAESDALHIHIDVDTVCISRAPQLFLVTLVAPTRLVMKEFNMTHEPGQPVTDFSISLPPSMDVCSLHVRISAGNSAGMSVPSEAIEVGFNTALTLTTSVASTAVTDVDDLQQESITTLIDNLKKIKMKHNQAYESVTRPQSATQVHTEPCPAYVGVAK